MSLADALVRPAPAIWLVKHRWLSVIGLALIPVVFTAAGSAAGQILAAGDVASVLLIAAAALISAIVGIVVMRLSGQPRRRYGFRAPKNVRAAWWFAPPAITVILVLATTGVSSTGAIAAAYLVLAMAVAINEETWFRGIVLAVLRPAGIRTALIVSSVLFGVLHLANLAGGADLGAALLQVAFAVIFGVVSAELAIVAGSLWPAIVWHAGWDFVNFLGGNAISPMALIGVALSCAVMLVYAIRLWRHAVDMKA